MGPIRDLKGVQKVLECLAALSRFIARLGEKGSPLPTPEEARALLLDHRGPGGSGQTQGNTRPRANPNTTLGKRAYVAATAKVVSAVIVVERMEEGHSLPVQRPVYYISEVLSETKARYPQI
jgi:hypothetical protein